jgi:hypothetical protein
MSRAHRRIVTWLTAVCLWLVAVWSPAQGLAMSLPQRLADAPVAVASCHDSADMPSQTAAHSHDSHSHGDTPCPHGGAACCPGMAAALPAQVTPAVLAGASSWPPEPAPRLSARAADIFKPPRVSS